MPVDFSTHTPRREMFDPSNADHLASFRVFLQTGNWGEVHFFAELPYVDVPTTVLMKHAAHVMGVSRETEADRQARFAKKGVLSLAEAHRCIEAANTARRARAMQSSEARLAKT